MTKLATVYRAAAKRIEKVGDWGCCHAFSRDNPLWLGLAASYLHKVFRPMPHEPLRRSGYWMAELDEPRYCGDQAGEVRDRRVLALCFMAALADAGDL